MNSLVLIIILLLSGCALDSKHKSTCQNNGAIDFMYIDIPCEECVDFIEDIFKNNSHIFSYDIETVSEHLLFINYCYNYKKITSQNIENMLTDNNFSINQTITDSQEDKLRELCCKTP